MVKAKRFLYLAFPWMVLLAVVVAILGGICLVYKVAEESSCNQTADKMNVADGDYKFLSGTCYLTLHDGRVIPANALRVIEH